MSNQLALPLDGFGTPEAPANELEERFWEFHRRNPNVYCLFDQFTRAVIVAGHEHFSADAILHRVRRESHITTVGEPYKINDHYSAYYSRLWTRNNPRHASLFRTKKLTSGEVSAALKSPTATRAA